MLQNFLRLLCFCGIIGGKVVLSANVLMDCAITVVVSTHEMNISGLAAGYDLQYILDVNGTLVKAFIGTYSSASLTSLLSGTEYVIHYGDIIYSCTYSCTTMPTPVQQLQVASQTTSSIALNWSQPEEYQSTYTYRVETYLTSLSTQVNYGTVVTNESATIIDLTAGETYTFKVYTIAADKITDSEPTSITACTVPSQVSSITVNQSVDSLVASWTTPAGNVDYYIVNITGDVNSTIHTSATQVTVTGLYPGREYTVTVQTVTGNCSSDITTVAQATYPSPPSSIDFTEVGEISITLSWGEPVNMTNVTKFYYVTYWNSMSLTNTRTVTCYTTSITLQNLTSGTNYTISVVTVGVQGYQSTPVSRWVLIL
ncbi:receptor-type tyrosine-protein phosphatase H-like isoform X2 [Hyperolius riggenbachi]|uniref:receptor-type tyrosine-protein phosphatase H-like isoform X2 n=1 Tax=Hyperolius riggenbachi TaxID=752182 RepID=UPI0035A29ACE